MKKILSKVLIIFVFFGIIFQSIFFVEKSYASGVSIKAEAAYIYLDSTNDVIYEKNAGEKLEIASITKLVTCYLAVENLNLDDTLTYKEKKITVEEALYRALLPSDNVAANSLAKRVSGTVDEFVKLMNDKMAEWGCTNTTFENADGRHLKNYSTCMDIVTIAKHVFSVEELQPMFSASSYEIGDETIYSTNLFLNGGKDKYDDEDGKEIVVEPYPEVKAGKTGTGGENLNMVVLSEFEGMDCYIVMLHTIKGRRYTDVLNLLNYAKDNISVYTVFNSGDSFESAKVYGGNVNKVEGIAKTDGVINLPEGLSISLVTTNVRYKEKLEAPIMAGDKIGECDIYVAGDLSRTIDILAKEDVKTGWFLSKYRITNFQTILMGLIILLIIALFILVLILRAINKKKKAQRRKELIRKKALAELEKERDYERRDWPTRV